MMFARLAEPCCLRDVGAFHRLFKAPVVALPAIPDDKRCALRVSLIQEELNELKEAIAQNDLVEVADALADIQYVLAGAVHEFGMGSCFAALFAEVQRSNMSKACSSLDEAEATVAHYAAKDQPARIEEVEGKWLVYRTADTKVLKSVNYSPTALAPILEAGTTRGASVTEHAEPCCLRDVGAFHRLFKAPVVALPAIPDDKRCALRVSLIQEELNELKEAIAQNDLVEVADALADIQYVLAGAVHEFGMGSCFAALFAEVQRSNMSKACSSLDEAEATVAHYAAKDQPARIEEVEGKWLVYRTADTKVLKSVNYSPTALAPILDLPADNAENTVSN